MGLVLLQLPAVEPVSAAEVARFLRLASESEAAIAAALAPAARIVVETRTGCALIRRTIRETRPAGDVDAQGRIALAYGPVLSIAAAVSMDAAGATAPVVAWRDNSDADYCIRTRLGADAQSVMFDYVTGFAAAAGDVPADLRQAVLEVCADLMAGRDAPSRPAIGPRAAMLMEPYVRAAAAAAASAAAAGGGGAAPKPPRIG